MPLGLLIAAVILVAGLIILGRGDKTAAAWRGYLEIFKSTRTNTGSIVNHSLSLVVFVICLIEFIVFKLLANSTFFLIMLMTLIDVIAGFTVTISSARRDIDYR